MNPIIQVEQLSKSYGTQPAVKALNLSVQQGEVFGLLGANGAGKSTTIECILGTKRQDTGTIQIWGQDPAKTRRNLFERIGVQFQEAAYHDKITVRELCQVTASLYQNPAAYQQLLIQFGISEQTNHFVSNLSGGQRQRLFIILALLPRPELVFLDELTTGLDLRARRDIWKLLADLKAQGLTIFLTSHFMDEVEALCNRICILKQGQSIFSGTVAEAIEQSPYEKFEDAYLWYTEEENTL